MRLNIFYVFLSVVLTLTSTNVAAQNKAWAMLQNGVMTFSYGQKPKGPDKVKCSNCQKLQSSSSNFCPNCGTRLEKGFEIFDALTKKNNDNFRPWNYNAYAHTVKKVVISPSFKQIYPTDISYLFFNMENLTEIVGIENLNTSRVTNMENLFNGCVKLKVINLSHFDTSKVTNMSGMFTSCTVSSLDVSRFNTSNVIDMGGMFMWCPNLERLDVSRFNTAKVTSFDSMFSGCKKLKSINVSKFKTENVSRFGNMFSECKGLTTLDISNFNTRKAKAMDGMFDECTNLRIIYVSKANWVERYEYNHKDMPGIFCNRYNPGITCPAKLIKK